MKDDTLEYIQLPNAPKKAKVKAEELLAKVMVNIYLYSPTYATLMIIFLHFRKIHPRLSLHTANRGKSILIL